MLAFINIGTPEVVALIVVGIVFIMILGNYGRNTVLGYLGSIILAILSTPVIAFIVITILRARKSVYPEIVSFRDHTNYHDEEAKANSQRH